MLLFRSALDLRTTKKNSLKARVDRTCRNGPWRAITVPMEARTS